MSGRRQIGDYPESIQQQIALLLHPNGSSPGPLPQPPVLHDPLEQAKGKTKDSGRTIVRVVSYRRRLLDEDNLCPKYFIDGLRYASLLQKDSPESCHIQIAQVRVRVKADERTEITVTSPGLLPPETVSDSPKKP
jgi:hypothetical protein